MLRADLAVRNASELCTMTGSGKGEAVLGAIAQGSIACLEGTIVWVGPDEALDRNVTLLPHARTLDATGCTVTPGLVDCHTHLIFAGDRSDEFSLRCEGATYLEIAARGGGINATVHPTRAASEEALVTRALPRLQRMLEFGITTVEIKSGYGLSLESELRSLQSVATLSKCVPQTLVPTLLCAHAIPPEYASDREGYLHLCLEEILPEVARRGLARFCDAFIEKSAFTLEEGRRLLSRGKELGLTPRIHADQLSRMGASRLAAELGAASADHLEETTDEEIALLAHAGVSAVLVPMSTLFLRQARYAPGRKLWDAGVNVALATNLNPGSAMSENPYLTISLACLMNGLSPAEAFHAFTRGGAKVLGLEHRVGTLAPGMEADLVLHEAPNHRHLAYHFAISHVREVLRQGHSVFKNRPRPLSGR